MSRRRSTQLPETAAAGPVEHLEMPSKSDLTAEDIATVQSHAEVLDSRIFGAPVVQTIDEQSAEIRATIKRIFARSPD